MSHSLRIAMVVPCAFPANHGTPAAIRELTEALSERGHQVEVVTYPISDSGIPLNGARIHRVSGLGRKKKLAVGPSWQRLGFDALLSPKITQVIKQFGAQVIHAHNFEGALFSYPARLLTGRPLIYNAINTMVDELHTYNFIRPKAAVAPLSKMLDYWVPRMADHIIADTQQLYDYMRTQGLSSDRVEVVPSGVNVDMFTNQDASEIRRRHGLENKRVVIYTGTFDRFQGLDNLIEAFPTVVRQCSNAVLLLLGGTVNEAHAEEYRARAGQLGIGEHVIVTSSEFKEVPNYLAASDVAVVPRVCANAGGIPTKLLNYMAAGKAIVCHQSSAAFLVHKESAWVVPQGTPAEFAEGIIASLNDPALATRMGAGAQVLAETTYSWKSIAKRVEGVYHHVLQRNGAASASKNGNIPANTPIVNSQPEVQI